MSEQAQKPDRWKFKALVFVLAGLVSLLAVALSVGGLAWLLDLTGLGLSVDARFTIATIIVCTLVVSLTIVVVGAFIIMSHTYMNSSTNQPRFEDPAYDEEEQDEEELDLEEISRMAYFKYLMARTTGRVMDGFPEAVEAPDDLPTKPHYRRTNSTKSHKRRRTSRK